MERMTLRSLGILFFAVGTLCCSEDLGIEAAVPESPSAVPGIPGTITDLEVVETGADEVTLRWTAVDDGMGDAAQYAVRRGSPAISWGLTAGTQEVTSGGFPGGGFTHRVAGLTSSTPYEFQAIAFRGTLDQDAVFGELSNVASASTQATQPPLGDPELVFEERWNSGFGGWDDRNTPGQHAIVSDPTGAGRGNVLRVNFTSDTDAGWLARWVTPPASGELHIRTHFYLASGWGSSDNVKLTLVAGNRSNDLWSSFGQAGVVPNGSNFFQSMSSMGSGAQRDRKMLAYTYHPNQSGGYGDETWDTQVSPSVGAWHRLDHYVKLNDVGQANGVVKIWMDGTLVEEITGLEFRTDAILDLNMVMLSFNGSGLSGNTLYYDDVSVFDGELDDVGTTTPPPPPPPPGGGGSAPDVINDQFHDGASGSWSGTRGQIGLVTDPTGSFGGRQVARHAFDINSGSHTDNDVYRYYEGYSDSEIHVAIDFAFANVTRPEAQRKLIYLKGDRNYSGYGTSWTVILTAYMPALYLAGDDHRTTYQTRIGANLLEEDTPYRLELYVKVNDPGASNGIIRVWLTDLSAGAADRTLVYESTGRQIDATSGGSHDPYPDRIQIGDQLDNGGYEGSRVADDRIFDRMMISTKEIGTYGIDP